MSDTITQERTAETLQAAFIVLKENGGSMAVRALMEEVGRKVDFSKHECAPSSNDNPRWLVNLRWYSVEAVKAGWLKKGQGLWHLTPEGEAVLGLPAREFFNQMREGYKRWEVQHKRAPAETPPQSDILSLDEASESALNSRISFEDAEGDALEGIASFIRKMDPYEFQDLVAALLRGMDYHVPTIARRGPDGGIDLIAYPDPLGLDAIKIIVQVKQTPNTKVTGPKMRELSGLLRQDGDVGLFVATGGFTADAITEAQRSHRRIQTINLVEFIELWQEFYPDMSEEDKARLPLKEVLFLAPPSE